MKYRICRLKSGFATWVLTFNSKVITTGTFDGCMQVLNIELTKASTVQEKESGTR